MGNNISKIDIVYTWVDGNDENYQQRKKELTEKYAPEKVATMTCRFTNNDELKYSLRSLEKYANWINKIYIVTQNQTPDWINLDNERIVIIDQKDIMPQDLKGCYNSNSIEHCIKNIPNLSEHFLYANDDFMLYDFVTPEFFFAQDGYPICRFDKKLKKPLNTYEKMLENSAVLIKNKFGKYLGFHSHHNIEAYKKSDLNACYETFKEDIDKTIYRIFRNEEDIQKIIYSIYAVVTKHGHFKKNSKIDQSLPFYKKIYNYIFKIYSKDALVISASTKDIKSVLNKYNPKLICFNDDEKTTDKDRKNLKILLSEIYPQKSNFEI